MFLRKEKKKTERVRWPVGLKDRLIIEQGGLCYICQQPIGWHIGRGNRNYYPTFEHKVPLREGGLDVKENLAVSHRGCNEERGTRNMSQTYEGKDVLKRIELMMNEFVDNWPDVKNLNTAFTLIAKTLRSLVEERTKDISKVEELTNNMVYAIGIVETVKLALPVLRTMLEKVELHRGKEVCEELMKAVDQFLVDVEPYRKEIKLPN